MIVTAAVCQELSISESAVCFRVNLTSFVFGDVYTDYKRIF